jgi:hypothetical protein
VKILIARGAGVAAVSATVAAMAMLGAGFAHADALVGQTYEKARSTVSGDMNATPVLSTVSGDQLPLDSCIVSSWAKSSAVDALGESSGEKILLNLNCNAKVAQAGEPGNSAMTPQGKQAKQDIKVANIINKDPKGCYESSDDLAYCKRVCNRTGLCDADSL